MSSNIENIVADKSGIEIILDFLPYPFILSEVRKGTNVNIYTNRKFSEEIGYTLLEIPDIHSWFDKAYPDDSYRQSIISEWTQRVKEALERGEDSVLMRVIIATKSHGDQWYEVKSSVTGNLHMIAFVNISELVAKENELARLNDNKNQTLSILAHDVRGPLTNLHTMTQWMLDGKFQQHEFLGRLARIHEKSAQVLDFIDATLLWTRANFNSLVHHIEDTSIKEVLETVLEVYENTYKSKSIAVEYHAEHQNVKLDKEIANIVLRNVISNAVKFTGSHGLIRIRSSIEGNNVTISVKDSGVGMSELMLEKIRLDHYPSTVGTAEEKGLGLGIKLCKQLLRSISGTLQFESKPGLGTEVMITIPFQNS
jgi:signal transduction histidine kinase